MRLVMCERRRPRPSAPWNELEEWPVRPLPKRLLRRPRRAASRSRSRSSPSRTVTVVHHFRTEEGRRRPAHWGDLRTGRRGELPTTPTGMPTTPTGMPTRPTRMPTTPTLRASSPPHVRAAHDEAWARGRRELVAQAEYWEERSNQAAEMAMEFRMHIWEMDAATCWEESDRERGESSALAGRPGPADVRGTVGRQNRENPWQVRD